MKKTKRLQKSRKKLLSAKNENGVARVITEPVSVASMHAFAAKQRENGAEIFFAAVEE